MWDLLRDLGTRLLRDLTGSSRERQGLLAAQIRLNERETENAPSSVLRLWRSFLGWVLALLFCWEVPVRLLLLPLLAPDLLDDLPSPGGAVMPVRRRKKALEKALHERLQRLTEHLDTAEVSEKSIDIVKEIKELHALARTLEQEGTSQDGDRNPPAPLRVIWAGQEPEDGPP